MSSTTTRQDVSPTARGQRSAVDRDEPRPLLKSALDPPRIGPSTGRHRSHDNRPKVSVQFVRRHHDTRPCLLNLAADRRIQLDQVHLPTHHHRQSVASKRVGVASSSDTSSPRCRIDRALAAHPARGRVAALTTRRPGSARSSTSSGRFAWSRSTLVLDGSASETHRRREAPTGRGEEPSSTWRPGSVRSPRDRARSHF